MGKSSSEKKGHNKVQSAPSPARNSPSSAAAATSWIDGLSEEDQKAAVGCTSPEELQARKEKMKAAAAKATANQQKELQAQQRQRDSEKRQENHARKQGEANKKMEKQLEKYVQQALKEGVVQSVWGEGDMWWAQIAEKDWKEVQDEFYCKLCDKHLNGWTLAPHVDSQMHRKKVDCACPGAVPVARPPPKAPASSSGGYSQWAEEWIEDLRDGSFRCIPCGKVITDDHLGTEDHKKRVRQWKEYQELETSGYKAPDEDHLAWVPSVEGDPGSERWMKCLLCTKFCQDESSHRGCCGDINPQGSKDHLKNLRNYDWHRTRVRQDRLKYHPETAATASAPATSVAKAGPATATVAPWAKSASEPAAKAPARSVEPSAPIALPPGWEKASDEDGNLFYWQSATGKAQWEQPTEDDASATTAAGDIPLPPGWQEARDEDGQVFYWHPDTNKTQWQQPTENGASAATAAVVNLPLPPGWEVGEQDGQPYYFNMETNESSWDPPHM